MKKKDKLYWSGFFFMIFFGMFLYVLVMGMAAFIPKQDVPQGFTTSILVFLMGSAISYGVMKSCQGIQE